jgi:hypothetical protein
LPTPTASSQRKAQSSSEKFVEAVWSTLGKMDNVEHVPGKGYRLKKKT